MNLLQLSKTIVIILLLFISKASSAYQAVYNYSTPSNLYQIAISQSNEQYIVVAGNSSNGLLLLFKNQNLNFRYLSQFSCQHAYTGVQFIPSDDEPQFMAAMPGFGVGLYSIQNSLIYTDFTTSSDEILYGLRFLQDNQTFVIAAYSKILVFQLPSNESYIQLINYSNVSIASSQACTALATNFTDFILVGCQEGIFQWNYLNQNLNFIVQLYSQNSVSGIALYQNYEQIGILATESNTQFQIFDINSDNLTTSSIENFQLNISITNAQSVAISNSQKFVVLTYSFGENSQEGGVTFYLAVCPNGCTCDQYQNCIGCIQNFYLDQIKCLCFPCLEECASCDNSTTCTSCQNLASTIVPSNLCTCPDGWYIDSSQNNISVCSQCQINCETCVEGTTCTQCLNSSFTLPQCICQAGTFAQQAFINLEENVNIQITICQNCPYQCLKCSNATYCSECNNTQLGQFLGLPQQFDERQPPNCTCPLAFYDDQFTQSCLACGYKCATCNQSLSCLTCKALRNLSADCDCSVGYYAQGEDCLPCDDVCQSCTGSGECLECKQVQSAEALQPPYCTCAVGFFFSVQQMACVACPSRCTQCLNSSLCTLCIDEAALRNGSVLWSNSSNSVTVSLRNVSDLCNCANDYYDFLTLNSSQSTQIACYALVCSSGNQISGPANNNLCTACYPCLACSGYYANCTQCANGYYLANTTCLACGTNCQECNQTSCNCVQNSANPCIASMQISSTAQQILTLSATSTYNNSTLLMINPTNVQDYVSINALQLGTDYNLQIISQQQSSTVEGQESSQVQIQINFLCSVGIITFNYRCSPAAVSNTLTFGPLLILPDATQRQIQALQQTSDAITGDNTFSALRNLSFFAYLLISIQINVLFLLIQKPISPIDYEINRIFASAYLKNIPPWEQTTVEANLSATEFLGCQENWNSTPLPYRLARLGLSSNFLINAEQLFLTLCLSWLLLFTIKLLKTIYVKKNLKKLSLLKDSSQNSSWAEIYLNNINIDALQELRESANSPKLAKAEQFFSGFIIRMHEGQFLRLILFSLLALQYASFNNFFNVFSLLLGIFFPIYIAVCGLYLYKKLNSHLDTQSTWIQLYLSPLVEEQDTNIIFKEILLCFIVILGVSNPDIQLSGALIVASLSLFYTLWLRPYKICKTGADLSLLIALSFTTAEVRLYESISAQSAVSAQETLNFINLGWGSGISVIIFNCFHAFIFFIGLAYDLKELLCKHSNPPAQHLPQSVLASLELVPLQNMTHQQNFKAITLNEEILVLKTDQNGSSSVVTPNKQNKYGIKQIKKFKHIQPVSIQGVQIDDKISQIARSGLGNNSLKNRKSTLKAQQTSRSVNIMNPLKEFQAINEQNIQIRELQAKFALSLRNWIMQYYQQRESRQLVVLGKQKPNSLLKEFLLTDRQFRLTHPNYFLSVCQLAIERDDQLFFFVQKQYSRA